MSAFQAWLVHELSSVKLVASIMHSRWGWPVCETVHFLGLSLLVGTIGVWDLRLLGLANRIPIAALHRLVPWGVLGFVVNVVTGSMFLMTDPREYIYNPAFHLKVLFLAMAGTNVAAFYLLVFRDVKALQSGDDASRAAKVAAGMSLVMWAAIIVCGRLLTFYRPGPCGPGEIGLLATCIP
jgi:hypothetical protein